LPPNSDTKGNEGKTSCRGHNKELVFQNKGKKTSRRVIANKELVHQNELKESG
jgi:hypothetical protein